jgi:hypothetical protein
MIVIRLLSHRGVERERFLPPHRHCERHFCLIGSNLFVKFQIAIVNLKAPSAARSSAASDMGARSPRSAALPPEQPPFLLLFL